MTAGFSRLMYHRRARIKLLKIMRKAILCKIEEKPVVTVAIKFLKKFSPFKTWKFFVASMASTFLTYVGVREHAAITLILVFAFLGIFFLVGLIFSVWDLYFASLQDNALNILKDFQFDQEAIEVLSAKWREVGRIKNIDIWIALRSQNARRHDWVLKSKRDAIEQLRLEAEERFK